MTAGETSRSIKARLEHENAEPTEENNYKNNFIKIIEGLKE